MRLPTKQTVCVTAGFVCSREFEEVVKTTVVDPAGDMVEVIRWQPEAEKVESYKYFHAMPADDTGRFTLTSVRADVHKGTVGLKAYGPCAFLPIAGPNNVCGHGVQVFVRFDFASGCQRVTLITSLPCRPPRTLCCIRSQQ